MAQPLRDEDKTGRTQRVEDVEMRSYELETRIQKMAKRHSWWVQGVVGFLIAFAIAAVKVGLYLSNVGHKDVEDAMLTRMAVYETRQQDLLDQVKEIARAVHAPVLPTPKLEPPPILKEAR